MKNATLLLYSTDDCLTKLLTFVREPLATASLLLFLIRVKRGQ